MISDSVELWDTAVCFLHIQLMGTNVRLPKIHKTSPEVDVESSRSPAKSESWNKTCRQCWAVLPTWEYCRHSCVMNVPNQSCQSSVACLNLFCDRTRKSVDRPQNVWSSKSCHVQTSIFIQFVSEPVIILQLIKVLPAWIDGHPGKDLKLCSTAPLSCLPARSIVERIFEHVLPCRTTTLLFLRKASPTPIIFQLLQQKYVIQPSLKFSSIITSFTWTRNDVGSSRSTFINFFHMGAIICFFPDIFSSSTYTDKEWSLFSMIKQTFPIRYFFPSNFN